MNYKEYNCYCNTPLKCEQPQRTAEEISGAKFCLQCGFPTTLSPQAEIRGSRGIYQVTKLLGSRGRGRLYTGVQTNDRQPVTIKEYLLPNRCFSPQESRDRKEVFQQIAGVSPADGRVQDFRLINPKEAIADQLGERCYLITLGTLETALTLNQYLSIKGAMTAAQVREVLNQTLQTLQFLHTQKLRLPSGQECQGIAHGNINLDSLLLIENHQQFYIYVCDLAKWECLFDPSPTQLTSPEPKQDLVNLGWVAFYMWVGQASNYTFGQSFNLINDHQWSQSDPLLKQFIFRLLGIEQPFTSAEEARQALLQLSSAEQVAHQVDLPISEPKQEHWRSPWLLLGISTLLLLSVLIWHLRSSNQKPIVAQFKDFYALPKHFSDINGVPGKENDISYRGETESTWSDVLRRTTREKQHLEDSITRPKPEAAQFIYEQVESSDIKSESQPLKDVKDGKAAFAITSLLNTSTTSLTNDLVSSAIAYDGLIVFVPFSVLYPNLITALEGGITLEELRRIYTEPKLTNWQQIRKEFPNAVIKLYVPEEAEAQRLFEHIVLQDDPGLIRAFHQKVTLEDTKNTLQQLVFEYEKAQGQVGIISFGILSKTWNQCQAYPVGVRNSDNIPIHAIVWSDGSHTKPSEQTDRCERKDKIKLNIPSFVADGSEHYPLGYPLTVVYPRSSAQAGSKFAEMLKTQQGQNLLVDVGLVPLQPIPGDEETFYGN